jgi:hypothetical protein
MIPGAALRELDCIRRECAKYRQRGTQVEDTDSFLRLLGDYGGKGGFSGRLRCDHVMNLDRVQIGMSSRGL